MNKIRKLPMQRISTQLKKTDLISEKQRLENNPEMQPKVTTMKKILEFASTYRVERITENQHVELFLN